MKVKITPSQLSGTIAAIASKSDAHRHLICAALSDSATELLACDSSDDIDATIACLSALGAEIRREGRRLIVHPPGRVEAVTSGPAAAVDTTATATVATAATAVAATAAAAATEPASTMPALAATAPLLDCKESGSTLRFMLPVAAASADVVQFSGQGRLPERPLTELISALSQNGVQFSSDHLPFETRGKLKSGVFTLPGNVSSQYVSGLLLALPLLRGDSEITLTSALKSQGYVNISLSVLAQYGIAIEQRATGFYIPGSQRYRSSGSRTIAGDWSNAAFFLAAGAIGAPLTVTGLSENSPQGDKAVVDLLRRFGADIEIAPDRVRVLPKPLYGCVIDIDETPDLLPALAVVAATAKGQTRFVNASRLRLKESDRLQTTAAMLRALGAKVELLADEIIVAGQSGDVSGNGASDSGVSGDVSGDGAGVSGDVSGDGRLCENPPTRHPGLDPGSITAGQEAATRRPQRRAGIFAQSDGANDPIDLPMGSLAPLPLSPAPSPLTPLSPAPSPLSQTLTRPRLRGGEVNSFRDHRIAMAAALAAIVSAAPVTILDAEAVTKSYPEFYNDYRKLGGLVDVI